MSITKITPESLEKEIFDSLNEYSYLVSAEVEKITDDVTKKLVQDTKRDAPRGQRKKFFKNISSREDYLKYDKRPIGKTGRSFRYTSMAKVNLWYVKAPDYSLTHLLAKGHKTSKGTMTRKYDFLEKNLEIAKKEYEKRIKEFI